MVMHMNVSGPWKEVLHKWLVKYVAEKAAMHLDARIIILGNPYTTALPVVKDLRPPLIDSKIPLSHQRPSSFLDLQEVGKLIG